MSHHPDKLLLRAVSACLGCTKHKSKLQNPFFDLVLWPTTQFLTIQTDCLEQCIPAWAIPSTKVNCKILLFTSFLWPRAKFLTIVASCYQEQCIPALAIPIYKGKLRYAFVYFSPVAKSNMSHHPDKLLVRAVSTCLGCTKHEGKLQHPFVHFTPVAKSQKI